MAKFGTFNFGEELFGSGEATSQELLQRVPWLFSQPSSDNVYEFAVNPLDCRIFFLKKTITSQPTAAGRQVLSQGRSQVPTMSFSGTILTEEHLNAMRYWSSQQKQVEVTDDLARRWWIYITSFNPTRNYSPEYPWRHEFSVDAVIVDWA